jgi:signal-transduction protein with cAMP-binding, CBS, and nucleotidyltransferase domain
LAPRPLSDLAPGRIKAHLDPALQVESDLPGETDRRLWRHVVRGAADAGAVNTLERLRLLEASQLFRAVPAEAMLDLVYASCRIKLASGETLLWQGDRDNDLYIVVTGELDALLPDQDGFKVIDTLGPGELVGEYGFITREPRSATVRAKIETECLVIHDADLQILCVTYPSILIQIASRLTHSIRERLL